MDADWKGEIYQLPVPDSYLRKTTVNFTKRLCFKKVFQISFRSAGTGDRKDVQESCVDYMGNFSWKRKGYNCYIMLLTKPKFQTGFIYLTNGI